MSNIDANDLEIVENDLNTIAKKYNDGSKELDQHVTTLENTTAQLLDKNTWAGLASQAFQGAWDQRKMRLQQASSIMNLSSQYFLELAKTIQDQLPTIRADQTILHESLGHRLGKDDQQSLLDSVSQAQNSIITALSTLNSQLETIADEIENCPEEDQWENSIFDIGNNKLFNSVGDTPDNNQPTQDESASDPLAGIGPSDELLAIYQEQADGIFARYAEEHGMTLDEYYQALKDKAQGLLKDTHPWMRVSPLDMGAILEDGKFKSGFETGTLFGLKEDFRTNTENGLFGYPKDMDTADRPVYGYPTDDPEGKGYAATDSYGSVAIQFKDEIKNKTTVTFSDTLMASDGTGQLDMVATELESPDGRSFKAYDPHDPVPDPLNTDNAQLMKYAELQYHGGLYTKDIERVVFYDKPPQNILDKLKSLNIPWTVKGK